MKVTLVFRVSEAASKVTERDHNPVRHGDTAGITTDDHTRLQKQKTLMNYFTSLIFLCTFFWLAQKIHTIS
jgi:hypothetical protein